jgi:hypothetical protein
MRAEQFGRPFHTACFGKPPRIDIYRLKPVPRRQSDKLLGIADVPESRSSQSFKHGSPSPSG